MGNHHHQPSPELLSSCNPETDNCHPPGPCAWRPTFYFLSLCRWLLQGRHVSGIIQFNLVIARLRISFLLRLNNSPSYMFTTLCFPRHTKAALTAPLLSNPSPSRPRWSHSWSSFFLPDLQQFFYSNICTHRNAWGYCGVLHNLYQTTYNILHLVHFTLCFCMYPGW